MIRKGGISLTVGTIVSLILAITFLLVLGAIATGYLDSPRILEILKDLS